MLSDIILESPDPDDSTRFCRSKKSPPFAKIHPFKDYSFSDMAKNHKNQLFFNCIVTE